MGRVNTILRGTTVLFSEAHALLQFALSGLIWSLLS